MIACTVSKNVYYDISAFVNFKMLIPITYMGYNNADTKTNMTEKTSSLYS